MDSLRQEMLEAQKRRADLMKWKLLLVSALAATGLGLTNSPSVPYIELVLCCIPLVCAYVDVLCHHQGLIVIVIAEFIRSQAQIKADDSDVAKYEKFALIVRQIHYKKGTISAYDLERRNLKWASVIFSASIAVYAATQYKATSVAIFISGISGVFLSFWVQRSYEIRRDKIREISSQLGK